MRMLYLAVLLAAPSLAAAQSAPVNSDQGQGEVPQRIRSVTLAPGQKCPPAEGTEIVVCSTIEEPYRIPRSLRRSEPTAANLPWASRVSALDDLGRRSAGLPNTCSPTGSGGQTGCTQALLEQWTAEQRAKRNGIQP